MYAQASRSECQSFQEKSPEKADSTSPAFREREEAASAVGGARCGCTRADALRFRRGTRGRVARARAIAFADRALIAVHRGDALWEQACREAGLALAGLVWRMAEAEMAAPLASQRTQDEPPARSAGLQPGMSRPGVGNDHSSTGKNACATDAALKRGATPDALLERSAQ